MVDGGSGRLTGVQCCIGNLDQWRDLKIISVTRAERHEPNRTAFQSGTPIRQRDSPLGMQEPGLYPMHLVHGRIYLSVSLK